MASLTFLKFDRVIQVDSPDITVTIQDLVNQIRDYEDELDFMDYEKITNAYGKQDLGGGTQIGITLELVNDWRIQFEARAGPTTESVSITGGNLVAINSYTNNPIKPSAFTQVQIAQSTSASIISPDADLNMLYLIEALHGTHKTFGSIFYWDPVNGVDTNDGTQPSSAVLTFAQAHTLATDGANDIIFCLASDASGITTVTETLSITKDGLKVRGPGYLFQLVPTTTTGPTVSVAANNVEVSGLYVSTAATGTQHGVQVTSVTNTLIKDCWVTSTRGDGINITSSARTQVKTCAIEDSGQSGTGNGISMSNTTTKSTVSTCIITGSAQDGADLTGTSLADNIFENNLIYNNSAWGIDINTTVTRTGVRLHHTFSGNTSGDTSDAGTATFIETTAGGASASSIADAVWDELIADHQTTGTTGRTLKDAKSKATLASLK